MRELKRAAVAIGVRYEVSSRSERTPLLLPFVADQAHHTAGLTVEAAPEADDFVFLGVGFCQSNGGLHRFGAAAVELRALQRAWRQLGEELQQRQTRLGGETAHRQ